MCSFEIRVLSESCGEATCESILPVRARRTTHRAAEELLLGGDLSSETADLTVEAGYCS